MISRIKPNPPDGPYPQLRLCGQAGIAPISISTARMIKMVNMDPYEPCRPPRCSAIHCWLMHSTSTYDPPRHHRASTQMAIPIFNVHTVSAPAPFVVPRAC